VYSMSVCVCLDNAFQINDLDLDFSTLTLSRISLKVMVEVRGRRENRTHQLLRWQTVV